MPTWGHLLTFFPPSPNFFSPERHCPRAGWPRVEVCQGPEWQPCGAEVYRVRPASGPTVHY